MHKSVWLVPTLIVLVGCGGEKGTSGGTVVVNPGPSPTTSPPPVTLNTGEVKPRGDAAYIVAAMELSTTGGVAQTNGVITAGSTTDRIVTLDPPGFSADYNAGYRLADGVNSANFGAAQLTADTTRPNGNGVVFFASTSGAAQNYLALYQQSEFISSFKGSGYVTARYGGTGGWQHTVVNGATRRTRLKYFGYGSPTPTASMPRTGVVRYSLLGSGNYATDTDLWFLSSTSSVSVTVDFSTGTVTGTMSLGGENFYKNQVGGVGSFPIRGNVAGNMVTNGFAGAGIGPVADVSGQFRIMFVGPAAEELVLTYVFGNGTRTGVGAAVGFVHPYAL
ncbi:hypothetical protein [Sphingomonas sp.]|jgi:hypothetical protein|uniref:hypothetical protein n=1 Tax=Sphingomonas sp. TaxID=28214 RepID=UPI002E127D6B|nr:hypothetical protein [Sphingomonas sp.]